MSKKIFDFCIGNPPYQEQVSDTKENSSLSKQLFPIFIKEAVGIANQVMLITPSRWFAGDAQDKSFLKLRDFIKENNHMKYLCHFKDAKTIFPNTEIKGGVNFFLYDNAYDGKITFDTVVNGIQTSELRNLFEEGLDVIISDSTSYNILTLVIHSKEFKSLTEITRGRNAFGIIGKEDVLNNISSDKSFEDAIELRCKSDNIRWLKRSDIRKGNDIVDKYKVFISKSAGSPGKDLKIIGMPYVGRRGSACTDSLIPIGGFDTLEEAENLSKYMKTKFLRYMVSILKMSQNVTQIVYRFVPLQDFTPSSDIDWSKSIHEIDLQLYRKYGLSEEEIDFIETNVREMV